MREFRRGDKVRDDGAVAQLGERRLCKPKVAGSIPVSSTYPAFRFFPNGTRFLLSVFALIFLSQIWHRVKFERELYVHSEVMSP